MWGDCASTDANDRKRHGFARTATHIRRVSFQRHLLIDGANILHAWQELRTLLRTDRDAARSKLLQRAAAIHDYEQVRVTIVHDGRGDEIVVERPSGQLTLSVVFTPSSMTADDVIEQMVSAASDPGACVVATEDRAMRETVTAAGGATMHAEDLRAWVERAEGRQGGAVKALREANERKWRRHE